MIFFDFVFDGAGRSAAPALTLHAAGAASLQKCCGLVKTIRVRMRDTPQARRYVWDPHMRPNGLEREGAPN